MDIVLGKSKLTVHISCGGRKYAAERFPPEKYVRIYTHAYVMHAVCILPVYNSPNYARSLQCTS